MIRSGIYSPKQLRRSSFKDFFGKEKNVSIYLYRVIEQVENQDKKNEYAELILNRFNSDRNVIKRTYKNRFNNFDKISVNIISEQNFENTSVLDIAVSDGRASCFFLEQSIKILQNLYYTGSDICVDYYLNKKNRGSRGYIVTDGENKIIEITMPPFVWNLARTEGSFYFINNLLKTIFIRKTNRELINSRFKYKESIELIHPDYRELLKNSDQYKVLNYNLFDPISGQYNVIRAMNILHSGYFSKDQLSLVFKNLHNGLELDGLLIEGSNENVGSAVEGAIYKKKNTGFTLVCEPERPSRIKDFVLEFSCKKKDE